MLSREARAKAFDAVERATDLPMLLLSLALIPLIVIPLLIRVPSSLETILLAVEWLIWGAFAAELLVKTYLAPRRLRYLTDHWFDVVIVVVPLLRPLRIVRSARALRLLRLLRLVGLGAKTVATVRTILSQHGLHYVLVLTTALVLIAAGAVTFFERDADGSITDFPTALWWAVTTITTVGYGDTYPVTPEGRGVGVVVMLIGITVFGLLTANVAAFLVGTQHEDDVTLREVMRKLDVLQAQVAALHDQLSMDGTTAAIADREPDHSDPVGKR